MAIIFDTETSGLMKSSNTPLDQQPQIVEFAAIKIDDVTLEEIDRIEFLAKPRGPLDLFVTNLTGITDDMVADAKPFAYYIPMIIEFFKGEKFIIAHNFQFDYLMLTLEMGRLPALERRLFLPKVTLCSRLSYQQRHGGKWPKLSEMHLKILNRPIKDAHRAMADVTALTDCVREMIKLGYFQAMGLEYVEPKSPEIIESNIKNVGIGLDIVKVEDPRLQQLRSVISNYCANKQDTEALELIESILTDILKR